MIRAGIQRGGDFDPAGVIWRADFSVLPLSTSANAATLRAALAAMGLTFTRASSATVQTSASTVVTSGIGVDDPRVGDAGFGRGLVLEEGRTNLVQKARDLTVGTGWNAGTATPSLDFAAGPDGSSFADRFVCASGQYSTYWGGTLAAGSVTASQWVRATSGTIAHGWELAGATGSAVEDISISTTWQRRALTATVTAGAGAVVPVSGRTNLGLVATARDSIVDLHQVEAGKFATEAILTTGAAATRSADILIADAWSRFVRYGVLSMEWQFVAKNSPANGSNSMWLIGDVLDEVRVAITVAGVVTVKHGPGAGGTSTGALPGGASAWNAGDVVRIHVEAGNLQTRVAVSINGGARSLVSMAAVTPSAFTIPANPPRLLNFQSNAHMNCWLQAVRAYMPGRRPQWAQ